MKNTSLSFSSITGWMGTYKRDIIFFLVGAVLAVVLIVVFIQSVSFLIGSVDTALDIDSQAGSLVRFDLNGLGQLNIQ